MSWIGKLARTERTGDSLNVIIHYVDDVGREYDQTISTNLAQSDTWLEAEIKRKINQLNALDGFENALNDKSPKATKYEAQDGELIIDDKILEKKEVIK